MSRYNLSSPTECFAACRIDDLENWMAEEIKAIDDPAIRSVVRTVCRNLDRFVKFPAKPLLLWQGCDRVKPPGKRQKYHTYPAKIKKQAKSSGVILDSRPNGPAIVAFLLAGGERPERFGSTNAWSIHHLYSGKFPSPGMDDTLHAPRDGNHFTQSAGLIAAHPIADAMCDEFPSFAWRLRAESFLRFRYDPDGVFSNRRSNLGFHKHRCKILYADI